MLMFHTPSIKGPQKERTCAPTILIRKWVNEDLDDYKTCPLTHPGNPHKGREKTQSSKAEAAGTFNATRINLTTEKASSYNLEH